MYWSLGNDYYLMSNRFLFVVFFVCAVNHASAQWNQLADFGGSARHRATCMSIGNKAYLGLGHINGTGVETYFSDWWEYDPATNSWTQKADFPFVGINEFQNMLDSRGIEIEGEGYVGKFSSHPFFRYAPATNTWTELNPMPPGGNIVGSRPLALDHLAYYFNNDDSLRIYNSQLDTWSVNAAFQLPEPEAQFEYWINVFSFNGKMYFKKNDTQNQQYDFWEYEVSTNNWTQLGEWLPPFDKQAIFEHHGAIIVACGTTYISEAGNLVYAYLPSTNSWSTLEDFPGSGRRLAESFTINGYGYLCGGTNGTNFKDLWRMQGYLGEEEVANSDFVIYPNPATTYFEIRSDTDLPLDVHLFNASGSKVLSQKCSSGNCSLNRDDLPSGMYVLKILSKGNLIGTKRVVLK